MKKNYLNNKEKILEYQKNYYKKNIDKIRNHQNKKCSCECGKEFTLKNKSRHEKSQIHQNYIQSQQT